MSLLGVTKVCSTAHPDTRHRWKQPGQMSLRCAKIACYSAAAAACCQREQKTRALQKNDDVGYWITRKRARFVPRWGGGAGWWDCAVCSLPGISVWWSSAAPETEYSPFLTIPEAPVSLWSSASGCTPMTKADWLHGAAVAITNATGSHTSPRFWPSSLWLWLFGLGQARFIVIQVINKNK